MIEDVTNRETLRTIARGLKHTEDLLRASAEVIKATQEVLAELAPPEALTLIEGEGKELPSANMTDEEIAEWDKPMSDEKWAELQERMPSREYLDGTCIGVPGEINDWTPSFWIRLPTNPVWPYDGTKLNYNGPIALLLNDGKPRSKCRRCRCLEEHGEMVCDHCSECGKRDDDVEIFTGTYPIINGPDNGPLKDWENCDLTWCLHCAKKLRLRASLVPPVMRIQELVSNHGGHAERWIANTPHLRHMEYSKSRWSEGEGDEPWQFTGLHTR